MTYHPAIYGEALYGYSQYGVVYSETSIDALIVKRESKSFNIDANIAFNYKENYSLIDAIIVKQDNSKVFTLNSSIKKTERKYTYIDSFIVKTETLVLTSNIDACIFNTNTKTTSIDTIIKNSPIIISPKNGIEIVSPEYLLFKSTKQSSITKHFHIKLDNVDNTFNNLELEVESVSNQTNWQYYNGSIWVNMPEEGMPSVYYGNNVRYYAILTNGIKFWKVRELLR